MDVTLMLIRLGAVLAAARAGWALGRANPGWEIDADNENMPRYYPNWGHRGIGYYNMGCLYAGGFFNGAGGAAVLGIVAFALAYFGWPDALFTEEFDGYAILLSQPLWVVVGCALVGYIASRFTDKGPVGPLE